MKSRDIKYLLALLILLTASCDRFLEVKPAKTLATPNTLADIRALLDDEENVNRFFAGVLEMGTDDYYLTENTMAEINAYDRAFYFWEDDGSALNFGSWLYPYKAATVANVVLESLDRINADGLTADILQGEAYFIRGFAHFNLAQVYCDAFDPDLDNARKPGLPLRLNSDTKGPSGRADLKTTYDRILEDVAAASILLPERSEYTTRANKSAAYALMARVYLSMGLYEKAEEMTDKVLERNSQLLDYNTLDMDADYPFAFDNPEIIFYGFSKDAMQILMHPNCYVDSMLVKEYDANDLRRRLFFVKQEDGHYTFKGRYAGTFSSYFGGLVTDETYLTKAECLARRGRLDEGILILNKLLTKRYQTGTFDGLQAHSLDGLLETVLLERRKQLLFRGLRWSDLKRLNKDSRFAKSLVRENKVDGRSVLVTLPPEDLRYTYLIPNGVLRYAAYEQNER